MILMNILFDEIIYLKKKNISQMKKPNTNKLTCEFSNRLFIFHRILIHVSLFILKETYSLIKETFHLT